MTGFSFFHNEQPIAVAEPALRKLAPDVLISLNTHARYLECKYVEDLQAEDSLHNRRRVNWAHRWVMLSDLAFAQAVASNTQHTKQLLLSACTKADGQLELIAQRINLANRDMFTLDSHVELAHVLDPG